MKANCRVWWDSNYDRRVQVLEYLERQWALTVFPWPNFDYHCLLHHKLVSYWSFGTSFFLR